MDIIMDISNFWKTGQIKPLTEGQQQLQYEIDAARRVDRSYNQNSYSVPVTPLTTTLTAMLDRKLTNLSSALSNFSWPRSTSPWDTARLVTNSSSDGPVTATVLTASESKPYYKYFSRGLDDNAEVDIDAGTYKFKITRGSTEEAVTVDVSDSDSWGDILTKVAEAINSGDSGVYAQVVTQRTRLALGSAAPGLGTMLALSVNPSKLEQDVSLSNISGHLLDDLNLRRQTSSVTPATLKRYSVSSLQLAKATSFTSSTFDRGEATTLDVGRYDFGVSLSDETSPTSYISDVFDPEETSTVAAGTYGFSFTLGDETRNMSLEIEADATWGDIMRQVSGAINSEAAYAFTSTGNSGPLTTYGAQFSMPGVEASMEDALIPSATTEFSFSDGRVLNIRTVDPFLGEDFTLTDGSGGLLSTLGLDSPIYGETTNITVQAGWTWEDVLQAVDRAAKNTSSSKVTGELLDMQQRSDEITDETVYSKNGLALKISLDSPNIGQRLSLHDGGSGLLDLLGLDTQLPGVDGSFVVNGTEHTSENNMYSLDNGRVLFEPKSEFVSDLPMTVVNAMDALETQIDDIVTSLNDLNSFISTNSDSLKPSLAMTMNDPVSSNWSDLSQLGFAMSEKNKMLWVGFEGLWKGLTQDPETAESALWEKPEGLVPGLQSAIKSVRSLGLESFFVPKTTFLSQSAWPQTENELATQSVSRLVDLLS